MAREGKLNDPKAQARLRKREKFEEERRKSAVAHVMSAPEGRAFMYDLLFNRLHLMDVYLTADSGIYRHEGGREAAAGIARELQTEHTEKYIDMINERLREDRVKLQVLNADTTETGDDDAS